jgi:LmbE family N-acetylglucosaminyl deacetylase
MGITAPGLAFQSTHSPLSADNIQVWQIQRSSLTRHLNLAGTGRKSGAERQGDNELKIEPFRLMCVMAHPDDESLGIGGVLAKYAAEGIETYLITATRGEKGWFGRPEDNPGPAALGQIREKELFAAGQVLGLAEVMLLDYIDGELDQADQTEVITKIAGHLRRVQPQVVITFDPTGDYGHPDHIAISQFTTGAVIAAADPNFSGLERLPAHRVSKLYYRVSTETEQAGYQAVFGKLMMRVDGIERRATAWKDWAVTTRINCTNHREQVWQAVRCHRSQLPGYSKLLNLPESFHRCLWEQSSLYRAYSLVNGGRKIETDLFAGLR